ncbi:hypothetical protein [Pelomonas sp. Root1237]|uniref:hypothetical protein n=1 Tax=Pelomonas sp. Root1237 TaxID=1736434 RepID=UPI0012F96D39|nr:hypothetical protein [Pelomonas sp. Root1237]
MGLLDANRHLGAEAGVSHWAFDSAAGRISARDGDGNLVMAIATGPLFGARLAAAFNSPTPVTMPYAGAGSRVGAEGRCAVVGGFWAPEPRPGLTQA